jgi:hypothetical protein
MRTRRILQAVKAREAVLLARKAIRHVMVDSSEQHGLVDAVSRTSLHPQDDAASSRGALREEMRGMMRVAVARGHASFSAQEMAFVVESKQVCVVLAPSTFSRTPSIVFVLAVRA